PRPSSWRLSFDLASRESSRAKASVKQIRKDHASFFRQPGLKGICFSLSAVKVWVWFTKELGLVFVFIMFGSFVFLFLFRGPTKRSKASCDPVTTYRMF